MTLNADFSTALAGLFDSVTGLGEEITLGTETLNALVRYEIEVDSGGVKFDVLDLDILKEDYAGIPNYRTEALVDGQTWYFWKQINADSISRRLRFINNRKFTHGK